METNGSFHFAYNNQPIIKDECVMVHNGIVVNDSQLWKKYPAYKRKYDVDTEILNTLLSKEIKKQGNQIQGIKNILNQVEGSYSIGALFSNLDYMLLATNTGSLYIVEILKQKLIIFASEEYFLTELLKSFKSLTPYIPKIKHLEPYSGILYNTVTFEKIVFQIRGKEKRKSGIPLSRNKRSIQEEIEPKKKLPKRINISNSSNEKKIREFAELHYQKNKEKISKLRRCTKCIRPETIPFINFDEDGVCNYCRLRTAKQVKGKKELEKVIAPYRNKKDINCLVAFSGGRDSSYGLHYAKEELGLNPAAFSYDWGMLTDLGRRNQARMTGSLGVEHVLVSADITRKRNFIKKNVEAWLKKPDLGTIPLFMAGDKQYFYHANRIRKQLGVDLVIMAENPLERTHFKHGFCGVQHSDPDVSPYFLSTSDRLKMATYYAKQYISNPAYINASIIDTIGAFLSFYVIPRNYLYLFDYIQWDEKTINNTLLNKYNWETATDTKSTWRIGDGTAGFYNYIYYSMAGFTENDTFRSNQIFAGQISREEALKAAERDNMPRVDSLIWYANTINVDMLDALKIIEKMPKRYEKKN